MLKKRDLAPPSDADLEQMLKDAEYLSLKKLKQHSGNDFLNLKSQYMSQKHVVNQELSDNVDFTDINELTHKEQPFNNVINLDQHDHDLQPISSNYFSSI